LQNGQEQHLLTKAVDLVKYEPLSADDTTQEVEIKEEVKEEDQTDIQSLAESLVEDEVESANEEKAEMEASIPSTFNLGDLAWAKVGTAPYWPCTVTQDPDSTTFTTVKASFKKLGPRRVYHVHFFGSRPQRAWVPQPNMLNFEGLQAFNELAKSATKARKPAFVAKGGTKVGWSEAVEDCIKAVDMSGEARLENCRIRCQTPKSTITKKRPRSSCDSPGPLQQQRPSKRLKLFHEAEKLVDAIPAEILEENRRKLKTGFKLFQLAHRENVVKNVQTSEVEKVLSKKWSSVSAIERKYYQDKSAALIKANNSSNSNDIIDIDSASEVSSMVSSLDDSDAAGPPAPKKGRNSSILPPVKVNRSEAMVGLFKKEFCCVICEEVKTEANDLLKCKGSCQNSFHKQCLGVTETAVEATWKCPECTSGLHSCNLCRCSKATEDVGDDGGEVLKCNIANCGRYFHRMCLQKYGLWPQARFSGKLLTCPAHMCHTCASDNPKDPYMKYNSKLVKCIRCPTAYHSGDYCVAAGT
jgi:hypothetical protein